MADPEPPEPVPAIPIKIVQEPPPTPPAGDGGDGTPLIIPSGKRNDDFYSSWDKFLAPEPRRAKQTSRAAREVKEEKELVEATPSDGLQIEENAAKSYEEAAAECKAKVDAIVEECTRLNQKYRDFQFDLEANPYCLQSLGGRYPRAVDKIDAPPWIKRVEDIFDEPQFYIDGASATDVHQGSGGDCWFLASLMAVSAKKELIEKLCVARNEKVGVYGFVFFRDSEWIYEVIDDKLFLRVGDDDDLTVVRDWDMEKKEGMGIKYDDEKLKLALQRGGTSLYFSHCKSNETWLPLIEKAYAKAHGDYFAIEGGFASEGIEDITGGVAVVLNPEDIMDKDRFWKEQLSQVNKKYLFGGGSKPSSPKGLIGGHAYAVLQAWEEGDLRLLKLRNPWGETEWDGDWSDGSKLWTADMMIKLNHTFGDDGVFWMSYKDFLKHFPCINRVRLFDDTWTIGQQWTCVNVPWTVDYLDTKFQFTISERGPVVVVLAQPDDRYFYGLRGRYLFSMHFRLYKEGEKSRWIVRSMHNSGNESIFTRSVSAEIDDLEPGTYDVVFKVTAVRSQISSTAEEAIMKFAVDRKEKLLHVGRRFDYAQTKGNLRKMEENLKKQKKQGKRDKQKNGFKKARKLNQQERERARKRKKRVDEAMREKRKEFEIKQRERAKARQERAKARRDVQRGDMQAGGTSTENSDEKIATPAESLVGSKVVEHPAGEEMQSQLDEDKAGKEIVEDSAEKKKEEEEEAKEGAEEEKTEPKETEAEKADPKDTEEEKAEPKKTEDLSQGLSKLEINDSTAGQTRTPGEPISPLSDIDSEYDSPIEPPEELSDVDFDWDSDMDGPVDSSNDEDEPSIRRGSRGMSSSKDLFADDQWNALCVLGLRVYSKSKDIKVHVVKGAGE